MRFINFEGEKIAVEVIEGDVFGYPIIKGNIAYEHIFEIDDDRLLEEFKKLYKCENVDLQNIFSVSSDEVAKWESEGLPYSVKLDALELIKKKCSPEDHSVKIKI